MAKTVRNLMSGSGTITVTANSRVATFSASQTFKPGATIQTAGGNVYTIDGGSGTTWVLVQVARSSESGVSFYTTNTSTSRARGGAQAPLAPNAVHHVYQSPVDDAGAQDCYVYIDTVVPENGVHPYTFDSPVSNFKTAKEAAQLIPDINTRVRRLEGALRKGRASGSLSQDYRLNDLAQRAYALERWANGQQGVPAVGSNATYTENDFIQEGDPA